MAFTLIIIGALLLALVNGQTISRTGSEFKGRNCSSTPIATFKNEVWTAGECRAVSSAVYGFSGSRKLLSCSNGDTFWAIYSSTNCAGSNDLKTDFRSTLQFLCFLCSICPLFSDQCTLYEPSTLPGVEFVTLANCTLLPSPSPSPPRRSSASGTKSSAWLLLDASTSDLL